MSRLEQWTPAQRKLVDGLRNLLPARNWWLVVAPPKTDCPRRGLLMGCNHTSWRALMPPCDDGCRCTVWALTPAEARAAARRLQGRR